MPLQPPNFFGLLDTTNPKGTDSRTISDDYHRMIQQSCKNQGPNWTDVINATHEDVDLTAGLVAAGARLLPGVSNQTIAYRYQNTADPNWVIEEPDANIRELIIGPAIGGGAIGGSVDPTNLTQTATVTITSLDGTAEDGGGIPSGLPFSGTTGIEDRTDRAIGSGGGIFLADQGHRHSYNGTTDPIPDHQHPVTGTGAGTADISIAPRYARGILQKLS